MASITDSFTYADQRLDAANPAWVNYTFGLFVDTNAVRPDGAGNGAHVAFRSLDSPNQHVEIKVPTLGNSTAYGVIARASSLGTADASTGAYYFLRYTPATPILELLKKTASSSTFTVVASATVTLVAGDVLKLEVDGTTYRAYINTVQQFTGTDATITSGNYSGIRMAGTNTTTTRFDDFAANDLPQSVTITAGIPSAEAFGTLFIVDAATQTVSPGGIASAEAFGTPSLPYTQTISPTGILSPDDEYTSGYGDGYAQFGIPWAGPRVEGVPSGEAFGTPEVKAPLQTVTALVAGQWVAAQVLVDGAWKSNALSRA